jgi:hypothetical protein
MKNLNQGAIVFFTGIVSIIGNPNYSKGNRESISLQQDTSKSIIGRYDSSKQDFNKFTSEHLVLRNDSKHKVEILIVHKAVI